MHLLVHRMHPRATLPERAESGSVGYDLCGIIDPPAEDGPAKVFLKPGARMQIRTGLAVAVPAGCYGRIAPRSGLAWKQGIQILAGVIDPSYRGELLIVLHNTGNLPVEIEDGARIAQLILEQVATPPVIEVPALNSTERGDAGFGSTG